jgi:branched-subunit amino acid ABC-type transport system permease component
VNVLVAAIGFGVASSAMIALGALGFTLQFGLSNILNIAYGAFLTLAAFLGYVLINLHLDPWLVMALTGVVTGLLSVAYYQGLVRGLLQRGASLGSLVIATFAAGIALEYAIVAVFGPEVQSYGLQGGGTFHLWYITLSGLQVTLILVAAALMLALHLLLTRTTMGRAMRATAVNRTLARSCGIRTEFITQVTWFLSGVLCGIAAVALAMTTEAFDFTLGSTFLIVVIAAAVVGGIGQPYGAMLGGLIIGLTTEISAAYLSPAYRDVIAFGLLVAMLLLRPTGILGAQARRHNVAG